MNRETFSLWVLNVNHLQQETDPIKGIYNITNEALRMLKTRRAEMAKEDPKDAEYQLEIEKLTGDRIEKHAMAVMECLKTNEATATLVWQFGLLMSALQAEWCFISVHNDLVTADTFKANWNGKPETHRKFDEVEKLIAGGMKRTAALKRVGLASSTHNYIKKTRE